MTSDVDDDAVLGVLEVPDAGCDAEFEVDGSETEASGLTDIDRVFGPRSAIL